VPSECQESVLGPVAEDNPADSLAYVAAGREMVNQSQQSCENGPCDPFEREIVAAQKNKWSNAKLLPQRVTFVTLWIAAVLGTSVEAYHLGSKSGNGTAFALAASTISSAFFFPLGNSFLFRLSSAAVKAGHWIYGGQDIHSRDKRLYDERSGFARGQLFQLRTSLIPNFDKAVAHLQANRPEQAASKIAEGFRVMYRLFRGISPNEPTLLDMVQEHFFDEVKEIPPSFYAALEPAMCDPKWKDIPVKSRQCRELMDGILNHWFKIPINGSRDTH
jgi:hypothetical protein